MTTATGVDTHTIEALDFDASLPCEHGQHFTRHRPTESPAQWVVQARTCKACGDPAKRYLICEPGRVSLLKTGYLLCKTCRVPIPIGQAIVSITPIDATS